MSNRKTPVGFLLVWHALAAAVLFVVADMRVVGRGFWSSRREELLVSVLLIGAYLLTALVSIITAARGRPMRLSTVLVASTSIFGAAFLTLLLVGHPPTYSRALLLCMLTVAVVLGCASVVEERFRAAALAMLGVGAAAFAGLNAYQTFGPQDPPTMTRSTKTIATALYTVQLETYANPVPKTIVRGGALAAVGDRYLLATGDGRLYVFEWPAGGKLVKPRLLPNRVPFNPQEFILDSHTHWDESIANADAADNMKGVQIWQFRVAGLFVKQDGERLQVFVSHHYWNTRDKCFTVRVSMLEAQRTDFLAGTAGGPWQTIFEATPCLPLEGPDSLHFNNPFGGMEIGGRMALIGNDSLLLTVGDHDFSGVESVRVLAQDPKAQYGKTILIHLQDRSSEIFTSGHRNPQGLFPDSTGIIWETEHGPQGGDELNILSKGADYGWPLATYGTDYGSAVWPLNPHQGHHDGFVPPVFAWVPSIGISNLLRLQGAAFPSWKDDLLVTSLHARTVFRMHIEQNRPVFAEPIEVGDRIRDIVEGADGQIVLWTDNYSLMSVQPARGSGAAVLFGARCGGCHKIGSGTNNSYGPDLYRIAGHPAGANSSFDGYSPAMKAFGKSWTAERLDTFIRNPQALVPGTLMNFPGVKDAKERTAIVGFLTGSE
jgi:cytochrome c2